MKKKTTAASNNQSFNSKTFFLGFVVVVMFLLIFWSGKIKSTPPPLIQSVAQLTSSTEKYSGMGTATKSHNSVTSRIDVTAFLQKPTKGNDYYVFVKGDGDKLPDMLLGKMALSGDVFGLTYAASDTSLYGYKTIIVVEETEAQAKANQMTKTVLNGGFSE